MQTIAVLRGGPSSEYEVSLATGAAVLKNLPEKYRPIDILIDRTGAWHRAGIAMSEGRALTGVDAVFNALHGQYGEDGRVQQLLESLGLPYTGSGVVASATAFNKHLTKEMLAVQGIKMSRHKRLDDPAIDEREILELFRTFPHPSVVKPAAAGSSAGVTIVRSFEDLTQGIRTAFEFSPTVLLEEYIPGAEATCGVIDGLRGREHYALFPAEIVPAKDFYDYESKYYSDDTTYHIPGRFTPEEKSAIEHGALAAHKALGLRHYSRSDFIVSPRRGVYFLEVNTLPGMTEHSLIPKSLAAAGVSLPSFLDHIIALAIAGK